MLTRVNNLSPNIQVQEFTGCHVMPMTRLCATFTPVLIEDKPLSHD